MKMCTRKKTITISFSDKNKHLWFKMPSPMIEKALKGQDTKFMAKCGKCWECKQERSRNWIYKTWLEAKDHEEKCFITLTIKNNYKTKEFGRSLNKKDLQDFIKRLRKQKNLKNFKYFAAGEYGETKGRAHYHIIALGYIPKDLVFWGYSKKGNELYRSNELEKIWDKGLCTIQAFHKDEIPYLSLYTDNHKVLKKVNYKELNERKRIIKELHIKYGIATKINNKYVKIKNLNQLTKEEYKAYKKEYQTQINKIKLKYQPEFNIWSNGMGFNRYIKDKYYKYELKIDNQIIERPKEYLRKIIENQDKYNEEIINYTYKTWLERKKHAEENYIDANDHNAIKNEWIKEELQIDLNANRIKLYKVHNSDF